MTSTTIREFDFGELRSLVQGAPSEASWRELCALLTPPQAERHAERWLPYATDALAQRWPDAQRAVSLDWIKRKRPPVMAQLARSLRIAALDANGLNQLLVMLERGALPLTMLDVAQDIPHKPGQPHPLWDVLGHPLHTLALSSLRLSEALCRIIAAAQATQTLAHLTITAGRPTEVGLTTLCSAGQLKTLELRAWSGQHGAPDLGAMLAAQLSPALVALRTTATSLDAALELLARERWPALRELRCSRADLRADALASLFDAAPGIEALHLPVNNIRSQGLSAIAASGLALRELDLSWCAPAAGDLERLLSGPVCAGLRALTLRDVTIDAGAAQAICARTQLARLELGHAALDAAFWEALRGASLPALEALDLSAQRVGLEEAQALCAASLPSLRALTLSDDRVTREARALLDAAPWRDALHLTQ